jgi:F0F1-type ATP synthase membrane subunit b/b'
LIRYLFISIAFSLAAWASEEAAGGHGEGDPFLVPKIVNFAILAAGIGYLIVKFAFPAWRGQQKEIVDGLSQAKRTAEAAAKRAAEIDKQMEGLQIEIDRLRDKAREEMKTEAQRIQADTEHNVLKIEASAEQEISSSVKSAMSDLKAYSALLALQLAEQKIVQRMSPAADADLIARFTDSIDDSKKAS